MDGGVGLVVFSDDRNGGSYRRMNKEGKGKSCRDEGGLLLLPPFVEKKFEGKDLKLERIWITTMLTYCNVISSFNT